MTRFNLTKPQRDFINRAVALDIVDAVDLFCWGRERLTVEAVMDAILVCAHSGRHVADGCAAHAELCKLNDEIRAEMRKAQG